MKSEYSRALVLLLAVSATLSGVNGATRFFYARTGKPTTEISTSTSLSTLQSLFDSTKQVKFLLHGWSESINSESVQTLLTAYLPTGVNVVMVDWTDVAGILIYPIALLGVPVPGGDVANLVDALVAANVTTKPKTHLIGFSMGAHVAGTAGSLLAPKVGRITGLDAGGPGYNPFDLDNWLDKSDAVFVDGIHTCGGYLGYAGRYAHVDFYPNKGEPIQPACAGKLTPVVCSHLESFRMFARTITNPTRYPASNSTSWSSFVNGGCAINSAAYMGEGVSPSTPDGKYYLLTDSRPCTL